MVEHHKTVKVNKLEQMTVCHGDRLVCCRMFSGSPGLSPGDASGLLPYPTVVTKRVSRHCQMPRQGERHSCPQLGAAEVGLYLNLRNTMLYLKTKSCW